MVILIIFQLSKIYIKHFLNFADKFVDEMFKIEAKAGEFTFELNNGCTKE